MPQILAIKYFSEYCR